MNHVFNNDDYFQPRFIVTSVELKLWKFQFEEILELKPDYYNDVRYGKTGEVFDLNTLEMLTQRCQAI
jgi:hypothetical protein